MSNAQDAPPNSGWTVVNQQPAIGTNSQGQAVPGWRINFVTGSKQPGYVWVPEKDFNPPTVKALIAQRVAMIDEIQASG